MIQNGNTRHIIPKNNLGIVMHYFENFEKNYYIKKIFQAKLQLIMFKHIFDFN